MGFLTPPVTHVRDGITLETVEASNPNGVFPDGPRPWVASHQHTHESYYPAMAQAGFSVIAGRDGQSPAYKNIRGAGVAGLKMMYQHRDHISPFDGYLDNGNSGNRELLGIAGRDGGQAMANLEKVTKEIIDFIVNDPEPIAEYNANNVVIGWTHNYDDALGHTKCTDPNDPAQIVDCAAPRTLDYKIAAAHIMQLTYDYDPKHRYSLDCPPYEGIPKNILMVDGTRNDVPKHYHEYLIKSGAWAPQLFWSNSWGDYQKNSRAIQFEYCDRAVRVNALSVVTPQPGGKPRIIAPLMYVDGHYKNHYIPEFRNAAFSKMHYISLMAIRICADNNGLSFYKFIHSYAMKLQSGDDPITYAEGTEQLNIIKDAIHTLHSHEIIKAFLWGVRHRDISRHNVDNQETIQKQSRCSNLEMGYECTGSSSPCSDAPVGQTCSDGEQGDPGDPTRTRVVSACKWIAKQYKGKRYLMITNTQRHPAEVEKWGGYVPPNYTITNKFVFPAEIANGTMKCTEVISGENIPLTHDYIMVTLAPLQTAVYVFEALPPPEALDSKIKIDGGLKHINQLRINIGGALKQISAARILIGGVLKEIGLGGEVEKPKPEAETIITQADGFWQIDGKTTMLRGGVAENELHTETKASIDEMFKTLTDAGGNYARWTLADFRFSSSGDNRPELRLWPFAGSFSSGWDLTSKNQTWFDNMAYIMSEAKRLGIILSIEFWDCWNLRDRADGAFWGDGPWSPKRNSTYTTASGMPNVWTESRPYTEPDNPHPFYKTVSFPTSANRVVLEAQERFVGWVIDEAMQYDNILFQVGNESPAPEAWERHWRDFVHARKPSANVATLRMVSNLYTARGCKVVLNKDHSSCEERIDNECRNGPARESIQDTNFDFADGSQNCPNANTNPRTVVHPDTYYKALIDFVGAMRTSGKRRPVNMVKQYWPWTNPFVNAVSSSLGKDRYLATMMAGVASLGQHKWGGGLGGVPGGAEATKAARFLDGMVKDWTAFIPIPINDNGWLYRDPAEAYGMKGDSEYAFVLTSTHAGGFMYDVRNIWDTDKSVRVTWYNFDTQEEHEEILAEDPRAASGVRPEYANRIAFSRPPNDSGRWVIYVRHVNDPGVGGPTITVQPADHNNVVTGTSVTFSMDYADGTSVQWYSQNLTWDPNSDWVAISGATNKSVTQSGTTVNMHNKEFKAIVRDAEGRTRTTRIAWLRMKDAPVEVGPSGDLADAQIQSDGKATLTVTNVQNTTDYLWFFQFAGQTEWWPRETDRSRILVVSSARDGYHYKCRLTGPGGEAYTRSAVTYSGGTAPPPIEPPPTTGLPSGSLSDVKIAANGSATLQVTNIKNTTSYKWWFQFAGQTEWWPRDADTKSSLYLSSARNGYHYKCELKGPGGTTFTRSALTYT